MSSQVEFQFITTLMRQGLYAVPENPCRPPMVSTAQPTQYLAPLCHTGHQEPNAKKRKETEAALPLKPASSTTFH